MWIEPPQSKVRIHIEDGTVNIARLWSVAHTLSHLILYIFWYALYLVQKHLQIVKTVWVFVVVYFLLYFGHFVWGCVILVVLIGLLLLGLFSYWFFLMDFFCFCRSSWSLDFLLINIWLDLIFVLNSLKFQIIMLSNRLMHNMNLFELLLKFISMLMFMLLIFLTSLIRIHLMLISISSCLFFFVHNTLHCLYMPIDGFNFRLLCLRLLSC